MGLYLPLLHHSQTILSTHKNFVQFCTFCFYIILKPVQHVNRSVKCLVSSAFTSFSNNAGVPQHLLLGLYLLLLHHSQTYTVSSPRRSQVCTFCFYIILKQEVGIDLEEKGFVPSAFTSFSNYTLNGLYCCKGLYLLLLHHSQTAASSYSASWQVYTFCFYIILKRKKQERKKVVGLVSSTFTSFSNREADGF